MKEPGEAFPTQSDRGRDIAQSEWFAVALLDEACCCGDFCRHSVHVLFLGGAEVFRENACSHLQPALIRLVASAVRAGLKAYPAEFDAAYNQLHSDRVRGNGFTRAPKPEALAEQDTHIGRQPVELTASVKSLDEHGFGEARHDEKTQLAGIDVNKCATIAIGAEQSV